jgi:hypothetical protein
MDACAENAEAYMGFLREFKKRAEKDGVEMAVRSFEQAKWRRGFAVAHLRDSLI